MIMIVIIDMLIAVWGTCFLETHGPGSPARTLWKMGVVTQLEEGLDGLHLCDLTRG